MARARGELAWLVNLPGTDDGGCLTFAESTDEARLRQAVGVLETEVPDEGPFIDVNPEDPGGPWAWFSDPPALVVEPNGFQGCRPEVIRRISRSIRGKAASVMWNASGAVVFTAARRGSVVVAAELTARGRSADDWSDVPPGLAREAERLIRTGVEAVEVGVVLAERFVGVTLVPALLAAGNGYFVTPHPDDLPNYTLEEVPAPLQRQPSLVQRVGDLSVEELRLLAAWSAQAAATMANLERDRFVAEALRRTAGAGRAGLESVAARVDRRIDELARQEIDRDSYGSVESYFTYQRAHAIAAVRNLVNADPLSAALACVGGLLGVAECEKRVREERGDARVRELVLLIENMLSRPAGEWQDFLVELPGSFSTAAWEEAIRRDYERESRGEFSGSS